MTLSALFDESLTVVYRALFLMFAEARGLVPNWHPLYRESYTIESLRDRIERPGSVRGLWETPSGDRPAGAPWMPCRNARRAGIQRPAVLAARARRSPSRARWTMSSRARRCLALSTHRPCRSTEDSRIDYRDLGVEQLGAVYESVLDYVPVVRRIAHGGILLRRGGDRRKSTGSFYTPQSLTDYLVRRTLHPLVAEAPADRILRLRIVDPAMGSAAFLVSACRYLARAYERALVPRGRVPRGGPQRQRPCRFQTADRAAMPLRRRSESDRRSARAAVSVARDACRRTSRSHFSIIASSAATAFSARRPLDVARQPPAGASADPLSRTADPLFADEELEPSLARAVERTPLDRRDQRRHRRCRPGKGKAPPRLRKARRWKAIADLWCSCWMWPDPRTAPGAGGVRIARRRADERDTRRFRSERRPLRC